MNPVFPIKLIFLLHSIHRINLSPIIPRPTKFSEFSTSNFSSRNLKFIFLHLTRNISFHFQSFPRSFSYLILLFNFSFFQTDTCFYTEMKIYPGKGRRFVRKDGRLVAFIDQKSRSLYMQKIKAQRLTWTQAWRRRNKKGKVETLSKKKGKRAVRVFKSIQGITLEDIQKKRDLKPDLKKAQREAAVRELKEKAKKVAAEKKKVATKAKTAAAPKEFVKVPKQRRLAGKTAVKSTQR